CAVAVGSAVGEVQLKQASRTRVRRGTAALALTLTLSHKGRGNLYPLQGVGGFNGALRGEITPARIIFLLRPAAPQDRTLAQRSGRWIGAGTYRDTGYARCPPESPDHAGSVGGAGYSS